MSKAYRTRGLVLVLSLWSLGAASAEEGLWVKGNTHTHTNLSDGNVSPAEAVQWYREHGYQFLVLTDHDRMAPLDFFDQHTDANFITIPGIELSVSRMRGNFMIHINAIGNRAPLRADVQLKVADSFTRNIARIREAGAIAQINHPSFHLRDRAAASVLTGTLLMEVHNVSSRTEEMGSMHQPLFEAAWDIVLTAGKRVYGVAADDTHDYKTFGPKQANPGGGWIMVHVPKLTQADIFKSLLAGDFYASSGVEVTQYEFDKTTIRIAVKPEPGVTHTIWFIGRGGIPLLKAGGDRAEYRLRGGPNESYVRVRVNASDGSMAWAQPIWPNGAPQ